MAETLVKNPTCSKCGEDARPQALFCHACGGEIQDLPTDDDGNVSSAWFKDDIVAAATAKESVEESVEADDEPIEESVKAEDEPIEMPDDAVVDESEDSGDEESNGKVKVSRKAKSDDEKADADASDSDQSDADTSKKKPAKKKLTPASELRKRPKPIRTKRVEVVWEEKTDSPNWLFVVFGLFFGLLGLGLFFLAFYLK